MLITLTSACFSSLHTDYPESGDWKVCSQNELNIAVGNEIYLRTAVGYSMCTDGQSRPTITQPPPACKISIGIRYHGNYILGL